MASLSTYRGKFRVRYLGMRDPATGKRMSFSQTFETKDAAVAFMRQIAATEGQSGGKAVIGPALMAWIDGREAGGVVNAKTADRERQMARLWDNLLGPVQIASITPKLIDDAVVTMIRHGGLSGRPLAGRTVHHMRQKLSQFLGAMQTRGELHRNPVRGTMVPRVERPKAVAPSPDQARALQALADTSRACFGNIGPIIYLLRFTGLRRGEVLALKWQNVDLAAGVIHVRLSALQVKGKITVKAPKTEAGRRSVPISAQVVEFLEQHRARQATRRKEAGDQWQDNDFVFCGPTGEVLNGETLSREAGLLARKVEGWPDQAAPLHGLRHGVGTALNAAKIDVKTIQTRLGHRDVRTTLSLYVHPTEEASRAAADALDSLV
jgi:integrase